MNGRHYETQPMHTDDIVAPGIRRFRTGWLLVVGIVMILTAVIVITLTLNRGVHDAKNSASLSSDEVKQLREFLADRSTQRDAERADVQRQLDAQRAVLCAAIKTLSITARPESRKVLNKAATDLRCGALPTVRSTSASTPNRSAPRATTQPPRIPVAPRSAIATAITTKRPTALARSTASAKPRPNPSPTSAPAPAPMRTPAPTACPLVIVCL